jgi:hypothetical protein
MARVRHGSRRGASRAPSVNRAKKAHDKKKPYKVVLEAVTQEKTKLHSIVSDYNNTHTWLLEH